MTPTKWEPCADCIGSGQMFRPSHTNEWLRNAPADRSGDWVDCPECSGAGGWDVELTLEERIERLEQGLEEMRS